MSTHREAPMDDLREWAMTLARSGTNRRSKQPHPLEDLVWQAFAKRGGQDSTSLGHFLSGASVGVRGNKAYHTVALDVLGYMEHQGLLHRDEYGWWLPSVEMPARSSVVEEEEEMSRF